jgi:hypothetical protein
MAQASRRWRRRADQVTRLEVGAARGMHLHLPEDEQVDCHGGNHLHPPQRPRTIDRAATGNQRGSIGRGDGCSGICGPAIGAESGEGDRRCGERSGVGSPGGAEPPTDHDPHICEDQRRRHGNRNERQQHHAGRAALTQRSTRITALAVKRTSTPPSSTAITR